MKKGIIFSAYVFISTLTFFVGNHEKTTAEITIYTIGCVMGLVMLLGILRKNKSCIKISSATFAVYYLGTEVFVILYHREMLIICTILNALLLMWLYFIYKDAKD